MCRLAMAAFLPVCVLAPMAWGSGPVDADELTARTITRLAVFDYRLEETQTPEDAELVYHLLGLAERLAPRDEPIARLRLEAAFAMGDSREVRAQTKRVLGLAPEDEILQLRLVTGQITERAQTAEQRLRFYDAFVGDRGREAGLSPAVRSRLALDAALLLREQGDLEGFAAMLERALTLDSTHKEAAALAHRFYAESVDDPVGRLDLLGNLLHADPVDPNVHDAIMRELAAGGAFAGALRFYANQMAIAYGAGREPDEEQATTGLALEWQNNGPEPVLESLNRQLQVMRDRAQRNLRLLRREGQPLSDVPRPDDVRLRAYQDVARVIAAHASGDRATVQAAVADLSRTTAQQLEMLRDPEVVGEDVSEEQVALAIVRAMDRLTTVRLLTGTQLELVEQDIADLDERRAAAGMADQEEGDRTRTYRGWAALRRDDPARAVELLESVGRANALARLGVALAMLELGKREAGLASLADLARESPLSLLGAWARTRHEQITGRTLALTEHAGAMESWAKAVPRWLDTMALDPRQFITFEVEPLETTLPALGRCLLRIRIRNSSPIPLAFGPGRPISSRVMLVPRTDVGVERMAGGLEPEVVDIQRRLRIKPLETFEVVVWPDPGRTGFFMELVSSITSRTRWRAVQGYMLSAGGMYQAGPMGLTDEANDTVVRLPLAETDHSVEELARRIREDDEESLPTLLAALRSRVQEVVAMRLAPEQEAALSPPIQAVADRYESCSSRTRLLIASMLQSERFFGPMAPVEAKVRADEDPRVRLVTLLTRVYDPGDELLSASRRSGVETVARVAEIVEDRLEAGRPSVAQMRPIRRPQVPQGRPSGGG